MQQLNEHYLKEVKDSSICQIGHSIYKKVLFEPNYPYLLPLIQQQLEEKQPNQLLPLIINLVYNMGYHKNIKLIQRDQKQDHLKQRFDFVGEFIQENQFYKCHFQDIIIKDICLQYESKLKEWLKKPCYSYIKCVQKCILNENKKSELLYPHSQKQIQQQLFQLFLQPCIIESISIQPEGLTQMFSQSRFSDLLEYYQIVSQNEKALVFLMEAFTVFVQKKTDQIIQEVKALKSLAFIKKVFDSWQEIQNIIFEFFKADLQMTSIRDQIFKKLFNQFDKYPVFLAQYCDDFLQNLKNKPQDQINQKLNQIIQLFRLLYSKDIFLQNYEIYQGKRLLKNQIQSFKIEHQLCELLKIECGNIYMMKVQTMLEEIQLQSELDQEWRTEDLNGNFNVKIITQGIWPDIFTKQSFVPNIYLRQFTDNFEKFYQKQHQDTRKLTWSLIEGQCEIYFLKRKYLLQLNTKQLILLKSLNDFSHTQVSVIKKRTQLSIQDLTVNLQAFLVSQVLLKEPESLEISETDLIRLKLRNQYNIRINFGFSCEKKIIQIESQRLWAPLESPSLMSRTRDLQIDSSIIRLMKTHKHITINQLIQLVMQENVLFRVLGTQVRQRIEGLMERLYLQRDDVDQNRLHYLP